MRISEILSAGGPAFPSIEIVPPKHGISKTELLDSIRPFMEFAPKYVNVTCHRDELEFRQEADGSYSRHMVRSRVSPVAVCAAVMNHFDVEVVPHVICAGATADRIEGELKDFAFMGVENLMALRGDPQVGEKRFAPEKDGYAHADELVAAIRRMDAGFCVGVGAYPEKHFEAANLEEDIANLKRKVDAGADYIITQMFFDNSKFFDFVSRCRRAGISVPIVPGIKPLTSMRHLELLPQAFSIDIPQELSSQVRAAGDDRTAVSRIGTDWCIAQCKELAARGVPAIHFFTMGKPENVVRVIKNVF